MAAKKKDDSVISDILKIEQATIEAYVLGISPLIYNRPSEKTKRDLLLPAGRKTATQKATTLKHNPREEYRNSMYRFLDPTTPTLLYHQASAFKGALSTAALDIPGAKKAQIGRLVWVEGDHVAIYGVPQLFMSIVRSADMARTPDVRTRAILPKWAAKIRISYIAQLIQPQAVSNLLAAGGLTVGIGDYRAEKGKGSFGQYTLVSPDHHEWLALQNEAREAQQSAYTDPKMYDDETETLLSWFDEEIVRREAQGRISKGSARAMESSQDDDDDDNTEADETAVEGAEVV